MIVTGNETPDISSHTAQVNRAYLWAISVIAAFGGLLFGYDWVVIGGAKPFYERYFQLSSPAQQGWAMSCALVGCLLGAVISGFLSDRFGRKRILILVAVVFGLTSLGTAGSNTFEEFVLWRMAGGLAIGLASSLSPMYIAEIAPADVRGRLVSLNQLTIVFGILLAQVVNWVIAKPVPLHAANLEILQSWNGQHGWRWMFGVTAIPATLFFLGILLVPESPRWLIASGNAARARKILERIGGAVYSLEISGEIAASQSPRLERMRISEFFEPEIRRPLLIGAALAILQQWCGINVILNYAQEVFAAAGYTLSSLFLNIVITGLVMFLFTVVAIATVDRQGRRPLMLGGCGGLALIYLCLGYAYYSHSHGIWVLLLVVSAIACYSTTLAPVTWVLLSELFPNRVRGVAMSIAVTCLWTACFLLTYTFPLLNRNLGAAKVFWIYANICVAGLFLVVKWVPETRAKTLEQIEDSWQN
ncbi:sugar porter family MFS transporter [Alloacidobacterium dinghuense]|uniref:Sugar porter family MFS transporter n=1 Tax=Alloacidobacterium dinghuense TaxID=2763107 RepID=A0A7G8BN60_9BACT|nr:sugar porter family MFS transporter [Alloacidobacterium dinghuense]QNI33980.1 sugar porter family MFS transporter [Alloacidobacterium dinghuense]